MLFVRRTLNISKDKVEPSETWRNRALKLFFMYYVYILRKTKDGKIYIGCTNDLKRRIKGHKDKKSELIYYEAYKDRLDAQRREKKLKQRGKAIRFLKERIKNSLSA